jgi:HAE1 family hydrophobic/amphiphilic exporter-1
MGGMCVATLLSLFIVPILYIVIKKIEERMKIGLHHPKHSELAIAAEFYEGGLHGDPLNGNHSAEDYQEDNSPKP